jgi:hypothetical protein
MPACALYETCSALKVAISKCDGAPATARIRDFHGVQSWPPLATVSGLPRNKCGEPERLYRV